MSDLAISWYEDAQAHYNQCISAQVAYIDEHHAKYVENKILEFYNWYKGVPTVTDIINDIWAFNSDHVAEGFNIELAHNPEFISLHERMKKNSQRALQEYNDIISGLLDSIGIYEIYDLVIEILNTHNKQYEMFDCDDFQYSDEVWSEDIFGEGTKIIANDCQNHLLDRYCSGFPKKISYVLSPEQLKRLRVMCDPYTINLVKLEAAK